jgi:hypothetical protein
LSFQYEVGSSGSHAEGFSKQFYRVQRDDHLNGGDEGLKDGDGEYVDCWNSNIVYSFNQDGELVYPGGGHKPEFLKELWKGKWSNCCLGG